MITDHPLLLGNRWRCICGQPSTKHLYLRAKDFYTGQGGTVERVAHKGFIIRYTHKNHVRVYVNLKQP